MAAALIGLGWDFGQLPRTVGHPRCYFDERGVFLDCRGPLIIHKDSRWGFGVVVLTASHEHGHWPEFGPEVDYGVRVGARAWICSRALLTGCTVGEDAVVAAGAVVRGQTVAPGVMVAGNPARVVARWGGERWQPELGCGYERVLA